MLSDFVTRILVLALGYAYPAFECFKAMEMGRVHMEQLQFWCQYWVIVAILTVFERFFDVFISWLPLYSEIKIAFFIYLWHPRTRGTYWVYAAFLRPLVFQHETEIEEKLNVFRAKSADLLMFYIKNFTDQGKNLFLELMHMVVSQPAGSSKTPELPRQPEPSAPPHPIAIKQQSTHQTSNSESRVELNPEVEEALRAARINLPRLRKK